MSTSLHKGMGYGMPWKDFVAVCPLDLTDDGLYDAFDAMNVDNMTVPDDIRKATYSGVGPAILETSLLSVAFTDFGRRPSEIASGTTLFTTVDPIDEPSDIIFFPNANYAAKWHRRSDDLDYTHAMWQDTDGKRGQAQDIICYNTYVEYGFYPFNNDLMLETGEHVQWENFHTVEQHPEWLPAVPLEFRWYLPKHNILKLEDVLRLRPIIAQWWS